MELDSADKRLLRALQKDGRMTTAELAEAAALSPSACHRRVKRLEDEGYITGYAAIVDRRKAGLSLLAYVVVHMEMHHDDTLAAFLRGIEGIDQVIACHAITGAGDYLLTVAARDMDDYADVVMKRLVRLPGVKDFNSTFVLSTAKQKAGWPLPD